MARKQQVFNLHLSDQNYMFLRIPKISWLKDIKLYIKGENSNERHFNFSGIKYIKYWKKFNSKTKKSLQASKLNNKYNGYLTVPWLDDSKPWKILRWDT